jgi:protein tyrosine phosphatase (PTP) superfamily phosphohydrolase (DUF442 family)
VNPPPAAPSPTVKEEHEVSPSLPVDIPQVAMAKKRIATGQQPFPDGVKWLEKNGYRTVLYVRAPGENDNAARRIFTNRGLRYESIEVSARTLSKEIVERFNRLVGDEGNQPLFVYDRDGALAGGLWYLHFRLSEGLADDKARAEAARLGFKEDRGDEHRAMGAAIQAYLQSQRR